MKDPLLRGLHRRSLARPIPFMRNLPDLTPLFKYRWAAKYIPAVPPHLRYLVAALAVCLAEGSGTKTWGEFEEEDQAVFATNAAVFLSAAHAAVIAAQPIEPANDAHSSAGD